MHMFTREAAIPCSSREIKYFLENHVKKPLQNSFIQTKKTLKFYHLVQQSSRLMPTS